MNKYLIFLASSAVLASAAWAGPKMLERGDTDSDGFLSLDELTTIHSERAERRFARVDADGDGLLSSDEIAAAREDRGNRKGPKGRKGKALDAAELDTDSDGFVTLQEFTTRGSTRAQERFARIDSNGDGLLSPEEFDEARTKYRDERRQDRRYN